ncbi:ABC transporter ATP-binding protein [Nocardia stercoris]|uniref:ATP-binding cassette domain-containing protein n=1 Tax=Nocardia stercoris TaxID=2483361 RepID=A0A3M2L0T2_9NOCA|nr:ATP-binding cassette domain-containing protein [Nocardia stercoris]RMI30994.1 ATP-binding cassette domain-containing protein [Nocardia stercoris]
MTTTLTVTDVTLTYPDGLTRTTALDRVSFRAGGGSVTGITGPSGSGKSSLLAVVSTLQRADTGTVTLESGGSTVDLTGLSRRDAATVRRKEIGIMFQQPNLLPSLTAVEQLEVTGHLGDRVCVPQRVRRATRARAMDLLDAVGLTEVAHRRPAQLSGGQRQRVNLARALMNSPALLVVDEPTSALDSARGAAVLDLIIELSRQHDAATLLVTHDTTHLARMDEVFHMADGKLIHDRIQGRNGPRAG